MLLDEWAVLGRPHVVRRIRYAPPPSEIVLQLSVPADMSGMAAYGLVNLVLGVFLGNFHGAQVVLGHQPGVLGASLAGEVVEVGVAAGCQSREYSQKIVSSALPAFASFDPIG